MDLQTLEDYLVPYVWEKQLSLRGNNCSLITLGRPIASHYVHSSTKMAEIVGNEICCRSVATGGRYLKK